MRANNGWISWVGSQQVRLLAFQLGSEYYGIDIRQIQEARDAKAIQFMPNSPPYIEGILSLRQEMKPIINLYRCSGIKSTQLGHKERRGFIVLKPDNVLAGIAVDKIHRAVQCSKREIQVFLQIISGISDEYVCRVVQRNSMIGKSMILLDLICLLDKDEFIKYDPAIKLLESKGTE